ncbi:MAG: putative acetyltransferase [Spirosomataceae bacterium]|jgi:putative acetyltransferase
MNKLNSMKFTVRKAITEDVEYLLSCFNSAVINIDAQVYSDEQKRAWVRKGRDNYEKWLQRIENQYFVIAESNNKIIGFVSVSLEGYVDLLFTHPDFQRKGIADTLYNQAENYLREMGVTKLDTHASTVSRPFFEKKGFVLQKEKNLELYGVPISNFHLIKTFN